MGRRDRVGCAPGARWPRVVGSTQGPGSRRKGSACAAIAATAPPSAASVVEEHHAGATLHGLARTHDVGRNLIRVWLERHEAGAFDEEACAADMLHEHEARTGALDRLAGQAGP